jgi:hypothetical protein
MLLLLPFNGCRDGSQKGEIVSGNIIEYNNYAFARADISVIVDII